jgi:hypothetical protein
MFIEKGTLNLSSVSGGSGVANNDNSFKYRGFYSLFNMGDGNADLCQGYRIQSADGTLSLGGPVDPETLVPVGTITGLPGSGSKYVDSIMTGYNELLEADSELFLLPASVSPGGSFQKYFNQRVGSENYLTHGIVSILNAGGSISGAGSWSSGCTGRFVVLD